MSLPCVFYLFLMFLLEFEGSGLDLWVSGIWVGIVTEINAENLLVNLGELDADGASEKSNGMSDSGPEVEITTGGSGNDGEAQTVRLQIGNLNALSILQKLQESKMGNGEGNDANGRVVGHSASGDAIYLPFSGSADGQKSPE